MAEQFWRFLYFYILYFYFLQKYIFELEIYRNIPRPPGCRAAGTWPPGCRAAGANLQKKENKIAARSLGTGRPAAGRPASQAARLGGARPPCWLLLPLICLAKNSEKRKEREGGRGGVRERQNGEALSDFQAGDFR